MFETQKEHIDNQSFSMEQSDFAIQSRKDNQLVVTATKAGLITMNTDSNQLSIVVRKTEKLDTKLFKLREQMSRMHMLALQLFRILKQKGMFETQKEHIDSQLFSMEQSNFAIQGMKDNQVMVAARKAGLKTMNKESNQLDLSKRDKV